MNSVIYMIEALRARPETHLLPPSGLPNLPTNISLPEDVATFYTLCGGGELFRGRPHSMEFLSPKQFVQANIQCLSELSYDEILEDLGQAHFSWGWYIFAEMGGSSEYVSINLIEPDIGSCYDCFWETYPDKNKKIAISFTNFLEKVYRAEGMLSPSKVFELL